VDTHLARQDQFDAMVQGLRDSADLLERLGSDVAVRGILVNVLGDLLDGTMATVRFVASALLGLPESPARAALPPAYGLGGGADAHSPATCVGSTGAAGSAGGSRTGRVKRNRSNIGSAFASRAVSAGRSKRASMKRRIEV